MSVNKPMKKLSIVIYLLLLFLLNTLHVAFAQAKKVNVENRLKELGIHLMIFLNRNLFFI